MAEVIYPGFRDQFLTAKYPFADSATLLSDQGKQLREDTLLDALLITTESPHLTTMTLSADQYRLTIGTDLEPELLVARGSFSSLGDMIPLADQYGRQAGVLVVDPGVFSYLASWTEGTYTFQPDATPFAAATLAPAPPGVVSGVLLDDGTLLTGEVVLYGGEGVVLSQEGSCGVRIDVTGDPLFKRAACEEEQGSFQTPAFVKTIDGCEGGQYGELVFTVDSTRAKPILRIVPTDQGIQIHAVGDVL